VEEEEISKERNIIRAGTIRENKRVFDFFDCGLPELEV
jgi:hypothetical protein